MIDLLLLNNYMQAHLITFYVWISILGLCVGSFLNVVIYRLPLMLKKDWHNQCQSFLYPDNPELITEKINLNTPRSHCPSCKSPIHWYHNIPVISWLALKGKCGHCKTAISPIYPLIEILTMILSFIMAYKFQVSIQTLFALILTWSLIALTFIDFSQQILPDCIVFPLIGLGLIIGTFHVFTGSTDAIWGCVMGFLSLWTIYIVFKLITGKVGMGYGDFKLLALGGAWFGVYSLTTITLIASILGCIIGSILLKINKESKPFAFGPYLSIGILAYLVAF